MEIIVILGDDRPLDISTFRPDVMPRDILPRWGAIERLKRTAKLRAFARECDPWGYK